jgi:hypothetical protein
MRTCLTLKTFLVTIVMVIGLFSQAEKAHAVTYWLQSQKISPPYPFDPYGGALKIERLDEKAGQFLVLDTPEDYAALQALKAAEKELYEKENGGVARNGPEDEGGEAYAYGPDDLWLEIVSKVDDTASFVIHTPDPEGVYDLFMTTNLSPNVLGLNLTNWLWLMRTSPGETNLVVTNLWAGEAYFRLGTMLDSDSDGMTDAYESLVAHTSSTLPDSDDDGLSDGFEFQLGFNPLDAYSQDSSHTFKDGQWYLTAKTGQIGTRAALIWDYAEYDPWDDITYLWFSVSGVAESEQHRIYIQTPSIDSTDTNLVWQDMFFNFGWFDQGYDQNTATRFYLTAWWGDITNAPFAALDGQDRDFDGLQDGYEILATQTAVGAPSSDGSGVPDGDAMPSGDGFSNLQKWQYGLSPWSPVNTQDTVGDGIPDWFRVYITTWFGAGATGAWTDADGDSVPNIVEFDIGSDPTIRDFGGYFPPPPNPAAQFVTVHLSAVPYSASQGPSGNPYFPTVALSTGPLGVTAAMVVNPTNFEGAGVADVDLYIMPIQNFYYNVWPFTEDGTPTQGELQRPDPDDLFGYREMLSLATDFADNLWGEIEEPVLQALRHRTYEYASATAKMRVAYACRQIQWLEYHRSNVGDQPGLRMRIQKQTSIVHTEITKTTAVDATYIAKYPADGLRYVGKVIKGVQWLSFAMNLPGEMEDFRERILDYLSDVWNQRDLAAPALLSLKIQEFLSSIPGMPGGLISTTTPIFDPCPLGFYEGGSGSWQDCLWPY